MCVDVACFGRRTRAGTGTTCDQTFLFLSEKNDAASGYGVGLQAAISLLFSRALACVVGVRREWRGKLNSSEKRDRRQAFPPRSQRSRFLLEFNSPPPPFVRRPRRLPARRPLPLQFCAKKTPPDHS